MVQALQELSDKQILAHYLHEKYCVSIIPENKVRLSSKGDVCKHLRAITLEFAFLVVKIKRVARHTQPYLQEMSEYLENYYCTGGELLKAQTIDELFDKIQPRYCFLNYEILIDAVKILHDPDLQKQIDEYTDKVESFKDSTTVAKLKEALVHALLSGKEKSTGSNPHTCSRVVLLLVGNWLFCPEGSIQALLEYMFQDQPNLLAYIHIRG